MVTFMLTRKEKKSNHENSRESFTNNVGHTVTEKRRREFFLMCSILSLLTNQMTIPFNTLP